MLDWSPRIMRAVQTCAIFLLAFMAAPLVHAAQTTLTCQAPTQNTDGTPLTNLAGFNLYGGKQGETPTKLDTKTVAQGCTFVRTNLAIATHVYTVTAFNSAGVESAQSNTVSVTVADGDGDGIADQDDQCPTVKGSPPTGCVPTPKPPTLVGGQVTAYEYRSSTNTMAMIGIVQPGTQCTDETKVIGTKTYNAVPYDPKTVDYYNSPQARTPPMKVWAICEPALAAR